MKRFVRRVDYDMSKDAVQGLNIVSIIFPATLLFFYIASSINEECLSFIFPLAFLFMWVVAVSIILIVDYFVGRKVYFVEVK